MSVTYDRRYSTDGSDDSAIRFDEDRVEEIMRAMEELDVPGFGVERFDSDARVTLDYLITARQQRQVAFAGDGGRTFHLQMISYEQDDSGRESFLMRFHTSDYAGELEFRYLAMPADEAELRVTDKTDDWTGKWKSGPTRDLSEFSDRTSKDMLVFVLDLILYFRPDSGVRMSGE